MSAVPSLEGPVGGPALLLLQCNRVQEQNHSKDMNVSSSPEEALGDFKVELRVVREDT